MTAHLLIDGYDSDSSDCNDDNDGNDGNDGNGGTNGNAGNTGSENGIDSSNQQHDDAEPIPLKSHDDDTTVNVDRQSALELEDSRGSVELACQLGMKRVAPNGDNSDDGSNAEVNAASRIKLSKESDHTTLADGSYNKYCGLLAGLQGIRAYQTSSSDNGGTPYFELECLGQDGQWCWIAESEIQRSVPSAVGTFWGCGPEDWSPPETAEGEIGREVWKRPLPTDGDGVPDALLIMGRKTSRSGQTKYLMQKVGYPAAKPVWTNEEIVNEKYTHEYKLYCSNHTVCSELTEGKERQLSAIVGHRLNGEKGSQKGIQFSCQWTNDTETWEAEDKVQKRYNAAVLTYWRSDPKARPSCKVPERRLQILGHEKSGTSLLLKVQMVGRSSCDGCAVCGNLPCRKNSKCTPNVPLVPVERLLLQWPKTTMKYVEDRGLAPYKRSSRVKRQSERLQRRKEHN
ncbi:Chromo domain protein [Akanthomyces lecanii RCEF 1005]|uniref:Chromo domain protein n=1 Tax=Akanthomyces lecanii RCEF 1005 TaxID=1081108 RepID=A0A168C9W0_CORDF|nr:Chromo domain protein [Akanthomyces lecanii RCEF 1005]